MRGITGSGFGIQGFKLPGFTLAGFKWQSPIWLVVMLLGLVSCKQMAGTDSMEPALAADPVRLRAHVEYLASDLFKGRDTGTDEYELAAQYVAAEFQKLGLEPGGDNGRYLQSVPLIEAGLVPGSATASISVGGKSLALKMPEEFMARPGMLEDAVSVSAETVFVGYGIVAPNRGFDDYAGLDVAGKIVVLLTGRPESWPSEEGAHYGSGRQKARFAAERGAVGMVIVQTPRDEKTLPFQARAKYVNVSRMKFIGADGQADGVWPALKHSIYIDSEPAKRLFAGAEQSLDEIFSADMAGEPVKGFELSSKVSMAIGSKRRELKASNVVAILEGSDPALKDEYLVYTAHLDHLGVIEQEGREDNIYNGAMDNAVGVALLLESARILSAEQHQLGRSIAFVAVTGEEKGLLGAGYFVDSPPMPVASMVANINLDMPVLLYTFSDITAFGAEHSSLQGVVERAASTQGIALSPDPIPEQAVFVRSDHYRFVLKGVPAIMLESGFNSQTPGEDAAAIFKAYLSDDYHEPDDDINLPIDYEAGRVFAEINVEIGRKISNDPERPTWNPGDFFGELLAR